MIAMDSEIAKGKPLRKEETKVLLDLIESSKILLTTNATSNKLKIEEWHRLTQIFNATVPNHRIPQQLRLKWENIKKIAPKRSTKIRTNQVKAGGGPPDYIPPDDLLDRVAGLLGSTASGFTVFGGDKQTPAIDDSTNDFVMMFDVETLEAGISLTPSALPPPPPFGDGVNSGASNSTVKKNDEHRSSRNLAIAEYFNTKKKYLEERFLKIKLENENLALKNLLLRMEIEKLKSSRHCSPDQREGGDYAVYTF